MFSVKKSPDKFVYWSDIRMSRIMGIDNFNSFTPGLDILQVV